MYPSCEAFSKVDFEPPDQGTKLLLLVCVELGQFVLTRLELLLIIGKVSDHELVLSCSLLELVCNLLEACQRHQSMVIVLSS